jgi:ABC-2 type transport system permease protein
MSAVPAPPRAPGAAGGSSPRRAGPLSPATAAVLRTETRLFGREIGSMFWIVAFPVVLLGIIGLVPTFREPDPSLGGLRLVDLYVPVSVLLSMLMAAIMAMPPVVFGYREAGVLRRMRTTPVRPMTLLAAQVLLHGVAVAVSTVLVLVVGSVVLDTPVPAAPGWYLLSYVLALLAVFGLGAIIMAVAPNARIGTTIGTIVFFPAMFTAGVYYPIQAMAGQLQDIIALTPLGAASQALYEAMAGSTPQLEHLAVLTFWIVVCYGVAGRVFRWE